MTRRLTLGAQRLVQRLGVESSLSARAIDTGTDTDTTVIRAAARSTVLRAVGVNRADRADRVTLAGLPPEPPTLPSYVQHVLARWRLLHDVPFRYLVPDATLLPDESIRFFVLDDAWLDELAAGAMAVANGGSREALRVSAMQPRLRAMAQGQVRFVRDVLRGRVKLSGVSAPTTDTANEAPQLCGFLLRSAMVVGWPTLSVRAWSSDDAADVPEGVDPAKLAARRPELVVPLLRVERLSPSVLLVLFGSVPRLVWLEEPAQSIQFGVEHDARGPWLPLRNEAGRTLTQRVPVPLRSNSGVDGVVDITALAAAFDAARPLPQPRGGAGIAMQLLQVPSRQRFGASVVDTDGPP